MSHLNVEIKARCARPDEVRRLLSERGADFKGTDRQVDTYFHCPAGRLKLREGNIENALIHYDRENRAGPKKAVVSLYQIPPDPALKEALSRALGVLVVVKKTREIYFIGNVKFHLDDVAGCSEPPQQHPQCGGHMELPADAKTTEGITSGPASGRSTRPMFQWQGQAARRGAR